jgi:KaiC/GvpD/RAD55 family RecA-like ATPase
VKVHVHDDTLTTDERVPTGISGLDEILGGGLPAQRVHLLEGDPGTGKTTVALQFLLDGAARRETCLYVSLSETAKGLRAVAQSHLQVQSISHGVIRLEQRTGEYGGKRRRLEIVKLRGVDFRDGYHDFRITTGGIRVQPRLVAANHRQQRTIAPVRGGIAALDDLLGGGLSTGTSAIIIGPAGVGKTSLATQFAASYCRGGGRAAIYLLDERLNTFEHRTRGLGQNLGPLIDEGRILVEQWDPDQITPGRFADAVRARVERDNVGVVLIDSLNGLLNALRDEATVLAQLHEITDTELRVGPPLTAFRGVLTGVPEYTGDTEPLLESRTRVSPS